MDCVGIALYMVILADTQMCVSSDLDLISDLPQSIVESILTRLPIREAVTKDNHFVK